MKINDKNIEFGAFHVRNHGLHHSKVIPDMQLTGGLNA
jgi:hypothetical protein